MVLVSLSLPGTATVADYPEHAHLSILCEIRGLLYHQLGMTNDEIANLFEQWYNDKVC
jgi:6-phosphogluconate dehydrogenase